MAHQIVLYDMPTKVGVFSMNTWRTRYALTYKGLSFTTIWVELPDIERELMAVGAPPSGKWEDGRPKYTVPTIFDPSTSKYITDAHEIARYLDKTYHDRPTLFPHGTVGLQRVFVDALFQKLVLPAFTSVMEGLFALLHEPSREYFRETREKTFGRTFEEMWNDKAAVEAAWKGMRAGLDWLETTIQENGDDSAVYVLGGDAPVDADFVVVAVFHWFSKVSVEHEKVLQEANGGRWARLIESVRQYRKGN
ncbi:hypothetical protein HDZ31DRAFT_84941 [Schizophyllum fasciatum]